MLAGAVLVETIEEWETGKIDLTLETKQTYPDIYRTIVALSPDVLIHLMQSAVLAVLSLVSR